MGWTKKTVGETPKIHGSRGVSTVFTEEGAVHRVSPSQECETMAKPMESASSERLGPRGAVLTSFELFKSWWPFLNTGGIIHCFYMFLLHSVSGAGVFVFPFLCIFHRFFTPWFHVILLGRICCKAASKQLGVCTPWATNPSSFDLLWRRTWRDGRMLTEQPALEDVFVWSKLLNATGVEGRDNGKPMKHMFLI